MINRFRLILNDFFNRNDITRKVFVQYLFQNTAHNLILVNKLNRMIDLDQLTPDWNLAEAHSRSTRPGKNIDNVQGVLRCPCCFRPIDKTPIGVCQNSKELEYLGFGFPLYFKFVKYTIIMVLLQVISYNALALYWSYIDNIPFCEGQSTSERKGSCTGFFVSIARLQYDINPAETIIRVGSFILQLMVLMYMRDKLTKANSYYDEITTTMSDYSIIIKDIPVTARVQAKLRKMFDKFFEKPIKIEQLVVIGHLTDFYSLQHQKRKLIEKKKLLMDHETDEEDINTIDFQLKENEELLNQQIDKQIKAALSDNLICQKVIVILQSDAVKQQVISQYAHKKKDKDAIQALRQIFQEEEVSKMTIMEAPEPNEIIWEHININRKERWIRQILGWIFTVLLIATITVIIYFLLQFKATQIQHAIQANSNNQESTNHQLLLSALAIVYAFIFAIIFVNKFVIATMLHHIAEFEKHPTKDKEQFSFGLKYTLCLFFTTALMTLLVEDVTLHNVYAHDYGVIEEESIMFFVNALFVPLLWFINPWHIFRAIRRKLKKGKQGLTQKEANEIMEDVPVSLGKLYGQVIETVWFTYMYATVIPVGAMVTVLGLSLHYWVDKYNLLNKCSIHREVSGRMCIGALKLLDLSLLMRPAGSLIFDFQIKNGITIQSIVCAGVAIIFFFAPISKILNFFHGQKFLLQEKPYKQVKDRFVSNYKTLHPVIAHKKMYLQSELSNLNFFEYHQKLKKKLSKKVSTTIQMSLLQKNSPIRSYSAKEVMI